MFTNFNKTMDETKAFNFELEKKSLAQSSSTQMGAINNSSTSFNSSRTDRIFGQIGHLPFHQLSVQFGTRVKYTPVTSVDTKQKSNINEIISTKLHCITCMEEYEGKSLEELHWEDYQAGIKTKQIDLSLNGMMQSTFKPLENKYIFNMECKEDTRNESTTNLFSKTDPAAKLNNGLFAMYTAKSESEVAPENNTYQTTLNAFKSQPQQTNHFSLTRNSSVFVPENKVNIPSETQVFAKPSEFNQNHLNFMFRNSSLQPPAQSNIELGQQDWMTKQINTISNNFKSCSVPNLFNSAPTSQHELFIKEPELLDANAVAQLSSTFNFTENNDGLLPLTRQTDSNKMLAFFHSLYKKSVPISGSSSNKLKVNVIKSYNVQTQFEGLNKKMRDELLSRDELLPRELQKRVSLNKISDFIENKSTQTQSNETIENKSGVVLNRVEYYTIPLLEELCNYVNDEGKCILYGFTVGRVGYGSIYFPGEIDVTNINLDEIVHIGHKEIVIYPDDSKKPPFGQGLNQPAQITLNRVWPQNKNKSPIRDKEYLDEINYVQKLERICRKEGVTFECYEPESGTWVFTVSQI